jgi:hypothetical protein
MGMDTYILGIFALFVLFVLYFDLRHIRVLFPTEDVFPSVRTKPEGLNKYNVIIHVHTQFSFDSLGKPSDIKKAKLDNDIDFVFITDHNNDDYKYFEEDGIFAGVEKNTPEGRVLLIGNELKAISHPNNLEFDHYKWKGEFSNEYLYELINVKDVIVWKKSLSILTLLKNLLILPLTRNIYRKWNALIPLDNWMDLYFSRALGLKYFGGLDHHVKFVYQEHTHGILIPSYVSGFKWVVNRVYSTKEIHSKEDILESIRKGNLAITMNGCDGYFWASDHKDRFVGLPGDKVDNNSFLNCSVKHKKPFIVVLKRDNMIVMMTERDQFSYQLDEKGYYHFEVYEYDFKIGNVYFGVRPVCITNYFEVVDEIEIYIEELAVEV